MKCTIILKLLFSGVLLLFIQTVYAQNQSYTGVVRDASNGDYIPDVNIQITAGSGTSSDKDGKFSLELPPGTVLHLSAIGYKNKEQKTGKNRNLEILLQPDVATLNEVVVVAYGSSKRKDLIGSVSTMTPEQISRQQISTISKALEGSVSGVQLMNKSGQPGEDATIQIRGMGSVFANSGALIVVDGVPFTAGLSSLNPNDIASMVVSKDAASNSLYGSRAANGVILITTKKGQAGKTNVSLQARVGVNAQGVPDMDYVKDPAQYYEFAWESMYRKALDQTGATDLSARQYASDNMMGKLGNYMNYAIPEGTTLVNPTTGKLNSDARLLYHDDWSKELIQPSLRQEYNLSINGSNNKTDYYLSFGYLDDPSYVVQSKFNRFNTRFNVNTQINSWLKTGFAGSYSKRYSNAPNYAGGSVNTNVFVFTRWLAPIVPYYAYDKNGNVIRQNGEKVYDKGTGQTESPYGATSRPFFKGYHPGIYLEKDLTETKNDDISLKTYFEGTLYKGLKLRANVSMDNLYTNFTGYGNNEDGSAARDYNGTITKSNTKNMIINTNQILTWEQAFSAHTIDFLAGHEFYYSTTEALSSQKSNMFAPDMPELNNAANIIASNSSTYSEALEGFFTRINYNYDSKYYLSGSYRIDGTSKFKYDKWGNFWSVGGAWRMAEERFIKDHAYWLDELKFRITYGTQGNQQISASQFPYTNLWDVTNQQGQIGITQSSLGNRDLTWEVNHIFDAGIDFRFMDRFYGSVDYFYRKTTDMIWDRPMPVSTGITKRLENVGEMENSGIEAELGVNIIRDRAVFWSVNINASHYMNKLLKLPTELSDGYISGNYYRKVGKGYYNLYMNKYAGVDPQNGDALLYKQDANGNLTTTNSATEATKFEVGNANPKLNGGISTNVQYKGFDLSVITSYQLGGKVISAEYLSATSPGRLGYNIHTDMLNYWTPQNPNTDVPRLYEGGTNETAGSTRYLFDASYFNLKNVTLSYDLPWSWTNKMKISDMRLFVSGENLWFKSAKKGLDPRNSMDGTGGNAFNFPQTRTVSVGVNINL